MTAAVKVAIVGLASSRTWAAVKRRVVSLATACAWSLRRSFFC
jgi:hypothetical protein